MRAHRRSTPTNSIRPYRPKLWKARRTHFRSWPPCGSLRCRRASALPAHVRDGFWILGNKRAWAALSEDVRTIVTRELDRSSVDQGRRGAADPPLCKELEAKGTKFIEVDREAFRRALAKTSFYSEWKSKYGSEAWTIF